MNQPAEHETRQPSLVAPWLFASLAILVSFALTRMWAQGRLQQMLDSKGEAPVAPTAAQDVEIWQGVLTLEGGERLSCVLVPFHALPELQEFRSEGLGTRWDLPSGELMRLILTRPAAPAGSNGSAGSSEALVCSAFEVLDAAGRCAQSLGDLLPEGEQSDSLLTLIGRRGAIVDAGAREQIAGWGRLPGASARLVLQLGTGPMELPLESERVAIESIPRSFAQLGEPSSMQPTAPRPGDDRADLERITELEELLRQERARVEELELARTAREEEILRFNSLLSGLPLPSELRSELGFEAEQPAPVAADPESEPNVLDAAFLRADQIKLALGTLLTLEGLYGLDLLEVGQVHAPKPESEGLDEKGEPLIIAAQPGWVGPVLFRLLDSFGRLTGSLHAQRLHLEGSRSSRSLHLVLSEGYESHQGQRTAFEGGTRRISLPLVDPESWTERLPELFSPAELNPKNDDGLWQLGPLRLELNGLLAQGSMAGWYRFHGIGGVMGAELMEVQIQEFDNKGRMRRRLFADRVRIQIDGNGVSLQLKGGASSDATGMHPFREGSHAIFLAAASAEEWRLHNLPGLQPLGDAQPAKEEPSQAAQDSR